MERLVKASVTGVAAIMPGNEARPMTAHTPAPAEDAPAAVSAFLRGVQRRAVLLAGLQSGDPRRAGITVSEARRRFTDLVGDRPLEQWPGLYWGLLLADPALRAPAHAAFWPAGLAWLGNLSNGVRATVLLRLVAGLQLGGIAEVLRVPEETAHAALRAALPLDAAGHHDAVAWQERQAALRGALDAAGRAGSPEDQGPAGTQPRGRGGLLWAGVAVCVLALAATFLPFRAPVAPPGAAAQGTPLPPSEAPTVPLEADLLLLTHPDLEQLADQRDAAVMRDLGFYAWYAARLADGAAGEGEASDAR